MIREAIPIARGSRVFAKPCEMRAASNDNPLTYWQQVQSALTHPDA